MSKATMAKAKIAAVRNSFSPETLEILAQGSRVPESGTFTYSITRSAEANDNADRAKVKAFSLANPFGIVAVPYTANGAVQAKTLAFRVDQYSDGDAAMVDCSFNGGRTGLAVCQSTDTIVIKDFTIETTNASLFSKAINFYSGGYNQGATEVKLGAAINKNKSTFSNTNNLLVTVDNFQFKLNKLSDLVVEVPTDVDVTFTFNFEIVPGIHR